MRLSGLKSFFSLPTLRVEATLNTLLVTKFRSRSQSQDMSSSGFSPKKQASDWLFFLAGDNLNSSPELDLKKKLTLKLNKYLLI